MFTCKRQLTDDEIWGFYKEPCKCEDCLNYEYVDEEVGWQCIHKIAPSCESFD